MKVRIIQGAVGPDGVYRKGDEHDLPQQLAEVLIRDGIAQPIARKAREDAETTDSAAPKKRNKR